MTKLLPISAIIPTRDRATVFRRTLESLAQQSVQPVEMIVVDGSDGEETRSRNRFPSYSRKSFPLIRSKQ